MKAGGIDCEEAPGSADDVALGSADEDAPEVDEEVPEYAPGSSDNVAPGSVDGDAPEVNEEAPENDDGEAPDVDEEEAPGGAKEDGPDGADSRFPELTDSIAGAKVGRSGEDVSRGGKATSRKTSSEHLGCL